HGVDARLPPVHVARPSLPEVPPQRTDLPAGLRGGGELRAPPLPRRGRAREGVPARPDAGRRMAEIRPAARAVRLHVGPDREEAAVHGRRVRAVERMEPRTEPGLEPAEVRSAPRRPAAGPGPQPPLPRPAGPA